MSTIETTPRPRATDAYDAELITRYSLFERLNHWFGALTYIYCLITGLAFWSPYLFWLATIVGGGPTARFWHPIIGLVFTASLFWTFVEWRSDMVIDNDDRVWADRIQFYIQNEDDKLPPVGPLQLGTKAFLLGNDGQHRAAASFRIAALVRRIGALEPSPVAFRGNSDSRQLRAAHDWPFPDPRLYEHHPGRRQSAAP